MPVLCVMETRESYKVRETEWRGEIPSCVQHEFAFYLVPSRLWGFDQNNYRRGHLHTKTVLTHTHKHQSQKLDFTDWHTHTQTPSLSHMKAVLERWVHADWLAPGGGCPFPLTSPCQWECVNRYFATSSVEVCISMYKLGLPRMRTPALRVQLHCPSLCHTRSAAVLNISTCATYQCVSIYFGYREFSILKSHHV